MSFGGSVQAMITSLKNNARPKKKAFSTIKNYYPILKNTEKLKQKNISDEQLQKIKNKIRQNAKVEHRNDFIRLSVIILVLTLILYLVFNFGIKIHF